MPKFYITTSIAYVNGPPHIGFALESIQADVIARYRRQQGDEAFFLTGTDEHGAKIARAAADVKKSPRKLADENAAKFKSLKKLLNLSWDDFIRTSDQKQHWPNVIKLWKKLAAAGDIYKKTYKGLYCVGHEAFVTEKDLADGKCRDHNAKPEIIEEENYFFRLSRYGKKVGAAIKSGRLKIYPQSRANEILSFIKEGVADVSFSRPRQDLKWGIPVPGDNSQTIYVWADALANYLFPGREWWPANLHVIGKDILRFHALYWPAMLLSAKLLLPKAIFVHGHITVEGQKMSKTLGNVIDPVALVKKYGADAVRYYLLRESPPFADGDFSYAKFEERYNADLADGLGNFAARVAALAKKYAVVASLNRLSDSPRAVGQPPRHREESASWRTTKRSLDLEIKKNIQLTEKAVAQKMKDYKLNEALEAIWELIRFGDKYLNEKKPWVKNQKSGIRNQAIADTLAILNKTAELLEPFLPETAEKIFTGNVTKLFPRLLSN